MSHNSLNITIAHHLKTLEQMEDNIKKWECEEQSASQRLQDGPLSDQTQAQADLVASRRRAMTFRHLKNKYERESAINANDIAAFNQQQQHPQHSSPFQLSDLLPPMESIKSVSCQPGSGLSFNFRSFPSNPNPSLSPPNPHETQSIQSTNTSIKQMQEEIKSAPAIRPGVPLVCRRRLGPICFPYTPPISTPSVEQAIPLPSTPSQQPLQEVKLTVNIVDSNGIKLLQFVCPVVNDPKTEITINTHNYRQSLVQSLGLSQNQQDEQCADSENSNAPVISSEIANNHDVTIKVQLKQHLELHQPSASPNKVEPVEQRSPTVHVEALTIPRGGLVAEPSLALANCGQPPDLVMDDVSSIDDAALPLSQPLQEFSGSNGQLQQLEEELSVETQPPLPGSSPQITAVHPFDLFVEEFTALHDSLPISLRSPQFDDCWSVYQDSLQSMQDDKDNSSNSARVETNNGPSPCTSETLPLSKPNDLNDDDEFVLVDESD